MYKNMVELSKNHERVIKIDAFQALSILELDGYTVALGGRHH